MKFATVCSGIEAPSVAWSGWEAMWFSEVDKFCCSLLKHHYPNVPNLGDMTADDFTKRASAIDLLMGGTPCQSFSVAGKRGGLDDPRGVLAFVFLRIAQELQPKWVLWENVPGVLSSNGGRDFGTFLWTLGQCGYGFAYRVLDAQYFGVPQRRRRVFVVGHLGDWRRAAAVLFERDSLQGNPAPSRAKGKAVAALSANGVGTCGGDDNQAQAGHLIVPSLTGNPYGDHESREGLLVPMAFDTTQCTSPIHRGSPKPNGPCHTLSKGGHAPAIAFNWQSGGGQPHAVAFAQNQDGCVTESDVLNSLTTEQTHASARACGKIREGMSVRRLTPRECERLQGFPDDYTLIPYRGKPAKDGPRYRAIGNSIAVPVLKWIGERIMLANQPA